MSDLAEALSERRRNLVPGAAMPCMTPLKTRGGMQVVLDSGDYPATQKAALERAGWEDFKSRQSAALQHLRALLAARDVEPSGLQ